MEKLFFLIGFMGVGKTYLGQKLADHLNSDFFDLDFAIEDKAAMDVNEIFRQKGEEYFRQLESQILLNWKKPGVTATGGGVILKKENRDFLKSEKHKVIWLSPSWDVIYSRISNSYRPMVLDRTKDELFKLFCEREYLYKECADIIFEGSELKELLKLID